MTWISSSYDTVFRVLCVHVLLSILCSWTGCACGISIWMCNERRLTSVTMAKRCDIQMKMGNETSDQATPLNKSMRFLWISCVCERVCFTLYYINVSFLRVFDYFMCVGTHQRYFLTLKQKRTPNSFFTFSFALISG